jgi:hypothetical protein
MIEMARAYWLHYLLGYRLAAASSGGYSETKQREMSVHDNFEISVY